MPTYKRRVRVDPVKPFAEPIVDRPPSIRKAKVIKMQIPDRMAKLVSGELSAKDLTDDEIIRGKLMDRNGKFQGGQNKMIPIQFYKEIVERQRKLWDAKMAEAVEPALAALLEVAMNRHPLPGDGARVAAAKLILERHLGKAVERIESNVTIHNWEKDIGELFIQYPGKEAPLQIEQAEVSEEDE